MTGPCLMTWWMILKSMLTWICWLDQNHVGAWQCPTWLWRPVTGKRCWRGHGPCWCGAADNISFDDVSGVDWILKMIMATDQTRTVWTEWTSFRSIGPKRLLNLVGPVTRGGYSYAEYCWIGLENQKLEEEKTSWPPTSWRLSDGDVCTVTTRKAVSTHTSYLSVCRKMSILPQLDHGVARKDF